MRVGVHRGQRQLHGSAHAHLVDITHVEDLEVLFMHEALFAFVDAANADLANPLRLDGRGVAADAGQLVRPEAAQACDRHAVDIAAWRECAGVEVGMRVEPDHAQLLALFAAMLGDCADGTYRQTMVTAEQHGQAA